MPGACTAPAAYSSCSWNLFPRASLPKVRHHRQLHCRQFVGHVFEDPTSASVMRAEALGGRNTHNCISPAGHPLACWGPLASLAGLNFLNLAPRMLPPDFCLLASNATKAGWELLPPLLAWKTSHWFSPVLISQHSGYLTWQVSQHKGVEEALCSPRPGRGALIPEFPLN